jgi:AcrR family transcriptional regulator
VYNVIDHSGQSIFKGFYMSELFEKIDSEKRDRIINSALKEFSFNSYEKASTNKIVTDANISKGLLFHYFKNKKQLYDSLLNYTIKLVVTTINESIDWDNGDFFERIKQIVKVKMQMTNKYPHIYDFLIVLYKGKTIEEIKEMSKEFSPDLMEKVYTYNIDYSLFSDEIDIQKSMSIIMWTLERYGESFLKTKETTGEPFDLDKIEKDFDEYIYILRKTLYKKEHQ